MEEYSSNAGLFRFCLDSVISILQYHAQIYNMHPMKSEIAIVGLGYVGLPLSLQFARSGVPVLGLDIDLTKVESLNCGRSYIKHISPEAISQAINSGSF